MAGITVTPEIAQAMDLAADQKGALVEEVVTGSPAEKAGLQSSGKAFDLNGEQVMIGGDIVTAVDGKPWRPCKTCRPRSRLRSRATRSS